MLALRGAVLTTWFLSQANVLELTLSGIRIGNSFLLQPVTKFAAGVSRAG